MKYVILAFLSFFVFNVFANNLAVSQVNYAETLVKTELTTFQKEYKINKLNYIRYTGIENKKYTFTIEYTKTFCDLNEEKVCVEYTCESPASVDSDAVVDFETEQTTKYCFVKQNYKLII